MADEIAKLNLFRDSKTGEYSHGNKWDRLCKCGHTLGNHTAESHGGKKPCIAGDFNPLINCDCEKFRPAKKGS